MKKTITIIIIIVFILTLDFFLEHHAFLGIDLLFPKSLNTKFAYASNNFYYSLSANEKFDIYSLFVNENISYFIFDSLINSAGNNNHHNQYKVPLDQEVRNLFINKWEKTGIKSKMINNESTVIKNGNVIDEYWGIFYFSPIKKIDDKIYVGFKCYKAPLAAHGGLYEIEKIENKWIIKNTISCWIS